MSKQTGFTLIELMIVVVVVGILTGIAVPAYTDHIVRGKIAQGVGALSEAKVRMEQVFNSERTYNCALDFSPVFNETPLSVAISNFCRSSLFVGAMVIDARGGHWNYFNYHGTIFGLHTNPYGFPDETTGHPALIDFLKARLQQS